MPWHKWFELLWLMTMTRQGLSLSFVEAALGVQTSTALRMLHRARAHMHAICESTMLGGPGRSVWLGTHTCRLIRGPNGRGRRRAVLLGLWDGVSLYTSVIARRQRNFIRPVLHRTVRPGSTIIQLERDYLSCRTTKGSDVVGPDSPHAQAQDALYLGAHWVNVIRSLKGSHLLTNRELLLDYIKEHEFRHHFRRQPASMFEMLISTFPDVRDPDAVPSMGLKLTKPSSTKVR